MLKRWTRQDSSVGNCLKKSRTGILAFIFVMHENYQIFPVCQGDKREIFHAIKRCFVELTITYAFHGRETFHARFRGINFGGDSKESVKMATVSRNEIRLTVVP